MYCFGNLLKEEGLTQQAVKYYRKAANKGMHKALIDIALMLPSDRTEQKHTFYQGAIKLGVPDAEIFYAKFLEDQKDYDQASEFLAIHDAQLNESEQENEGGTSSSDEESPEKEDSPLGIEAVSKEDIKQSLSPTMTEETLVVKKVTKKEKKFLQKLKKAYERAQKRREEQKLKMEFSLTSERFQKPKSYEDVIVVASPSLHEDIATHKHKIKIQGLISHLANGESRGRFEQLKGYEDIIYSMRITQQDRLVFKILEGNMVQGVKKIHILAVEGHYNGLEEKVSANGQIKELNWEKVV